MAYPSPGTPVQTQFATSVTSMPVNMPATVNAGDRLIAVVSVRNAGTFTRPSGWNELNAQTGGGGGVGKTTVFEKIAAGTEAGTTPTWTASTGTTGIWQVIRVTGAHASTPSEVTVTSGDSSAANPPSITPSWGAADDLFIAIAGHAAISAAAWSAGPTNYTGFQNNGASSGGSAVSIASATRQLNATSEDPGTFTVSGSNRFWAAATIAIRPSGGSTQTATLTGIASAVSIGSITVARTRTIGLTAISSTVVLGSVTVVRGVKIISLAAIGSAATLGAINPIFVAQLSSINSSASLGVITIVPGVKNVSLSGIASAVALGAITPLKRISAALSGINSGVSIGSITVVPGVRAISLGGISSTLGFGSITIRGAKSVSLSGIGSTVSIGTITIVTAPRAILTGIEPTVAFGTIAIINTVIPYDEIGVISFEDTFTIAGDEQSLLVVTKEDSINVLVYTDDILVKGANTDIGVSGSVSEINIVVVEDTLVIRL